MRLRAAPSTMQEARRATSLSEYGRLVLAVKAELRN